MALKQWVIGGAIAGTAVLTSIFGLPRVITGAGKLVWYGVVGKPQSYVTVRYNVSKDKQMEFAMPEESQGAVASYLAMHEDSPEQTGLELVAADADDGTVDGRITAEGISKLVHGYFRERVKDYNGRVKLQEIFKDSPLYKDPFKPGSATFDKP